jgi:hypothetical protein
LEIAMNINVGVDISIRRIQDVLCCGLEGGIGYWATITGYEDPTSLQYQLCSDRVYRHVDYPVNEGGAVVLVEFDDEGDIDEHRLDLSAIQRGIKLMAKDYPEHLCDILSENEDAITGDILIQLAVLGEVRYG